jgi:hypothetical protein
MRCSAAVQVARYRAAGAPPCDPPIPKSGRAIVTLQYLSQAMSRKRGERRAEAV